MVCYRGEYLGVGYRRIYVIGLKTGTVPPEYEIEGYNLIIKSLTQELAGIYQCRLFNKQTETGAAMVIGVCKLFINIKLKINL